MKQFEETIKKIDLFSEPVLFKFKGKKKFSTIAGAMLTICLIGILSAFSSNRFFSALNRSAPIVQASEEINFSPANVDLKGRFALAMSPYFFTALRGKRYFDFSFALVTHTLKNGSLVKERMNINPVQCNNSHFPLIKEEQLNNQNLSTWICPEFDNNTDMSVKGKYLDEVYRFIQIGVFKCSNKTNLYQGDYCASDDEIESMKKTFGKFYVTVIMVNNLMKLNDFENPISVYIETMDFLIDTYNKFVQREISFTITTLRTESTQSFTYFQNENDVKEQKSFQYERKYEEFSTNENATASNNRIYSSIYLKSDKMQKNFVRSYETFQDFLETLGSLYSIFFFLIKLINNLITSNMQQQALAKSLYLFDENQKKNKKYNCFSRIKEKLSTSMLSKKTRKLLDYDHDILTMLGQIKLVDSLKFLLLDEDQNLLIDLTRKPRFQESGNSLRFEQQSSAVKNKILPSKIAIRFMFSRGKTKKRLDSVNVIDKICNSLIKMMDSNTDVSKKLVTLLDIDLLGRILKTENKENLLEELNLKRMQDKKSRMSRIKVDL